MKYVLWALISGSVHSSYLGEFNSLQACQNAIRSRLEMGLSELALQQPQVKQAIDTALKYQRNYVCVAQD